MAATVASDALPLLRPITIIRFLREGGSHLRCALLQVWVALEANLPADYGDVDLCLWDLGLGDGHDVL